MLHSSMGLGCLLAQIVKYTLFFFYFPLIPGEGHKLCILGSPDPLEFRGGLRARQIT
jgi:hypothetical protein